MKKDDFMKIALTSATEGIHASHGGPFGACIVCHDEVIAVAHNTVLRDNDPTCHAEMNAIRMAAKTLKTHDLSSCEIYSTSEPCPMCRAAIYWAGIKKIIFGVDQSIAANYGFNDEVFYQQLQLQPHQRNVQEEQGYCAKEIDDLFKEWKKLGLPLY